MRILLLANHLNTGGITTYLMTLSRGLVAAGHRVVLGTSGGDLVSEVEALGVRHVRLNVRMKCEINPLLFFNLPALLKILKDEKIEVIHAQTRVTAMLSAVASRISGVPYITTCHGYFTPHPGRRLLPLWGRRVIAISRSVVQHLVQDFGVDLNRIDLVGNGIDAEVFRPATSLERDKNRWEYGIGVEPVIGIIARLSDVKGHEFLIDAMEDVKAAYPEVKCLIIGEGPMEAALKSRVRDFGLEGSVIFLPIKNKTSEMLKMFDVFVLPSMSEGLGLAVMEAMAAGLPVVATAVGGLVDLIQDGETGFLVPPKDPDALAIAIVTLVADHNTASAMGERARASILKNYSVGQMITGTLDVYGKVGVDKEG
jgi:glycosyltransferase involved in cell wall biosynthesis